MSIDSLLNQIVTHYPESSFDRYGAEVDSVTGTQYKARVQLVTKTRLLPNGQVVQTDVLCDVVGDPSIARGDRLDYLAVKYRVYTKKQAIDGIGNVHHTRFELQKWSK